MRTSIHRRLRPGSGQTGVAVAVASRAAGRALRSLRVCCGRTRGVHRDVSRGSRCVRERRSGTAATLVFPARRRDAREPFRPRPERLGGSAGHNGQGGGTRPDGRALGFDQIAKYVTGEIGAFTSSSASSPRWTVAMRSRPFRCGARACSGGRTTGGGSFTATQIRSPASNRSSRSFRNNGGGEPRADATSRPSGQEPLRPGEVRRPG